MATTVRLLSDHILSSVRYRAGDLVSIDSTMATQLVAGGVADNAAAAISEAVAEGKAIQYPAVDVLTSGKTFAIKSENYSDILSGRPPANANGGKPFTWQVGLTTYNSNGDIWSLASDGYVLTTDIAFPQYGFYNNAGVYNPTANWRSAIVPVVEGDEVGYTLQSASTASFVTFLDSNFSRISSIDNANAGGGVFSGTAAVPTGAKYAVFGSAIAGVGVSSNYTYSKSSGAYTPKTIIVSKTITPSAVNFNAIVTALTAWKDGDTILVYEGVYAEKSIVIPNGCHAKAIGSVEIRGELPANSTSATIEATSTVDFKESGTLENFKITARNMRYPVHSDGGTSIDIEQHLINCELVHYGNKEVYDYRVANSSVSPNSPSQVFRAQSAFGCGTMTGAKIYLKSTKLISHGRAFSIHNNSNYNLTRGASLVQLDDCELVSYGIDVDGTVLPFSLSAFVQSLGSNTYDKVIFNNTRINGFIVLQSSSWDWREFTQDISGGGNTDHLMQVRNTGGGGYTMTSQLIAQNSFIVKIVSNTADPITVSGNLTEALLGNYEKLTGSAGLNSYVKARVNADVAYAAVNAYASAKTITFVSGADTKSITLAGGYANAAALVSDLNTKFGAGSFVASLYWSGFDWYPKFTNEIKAVKNNGATAILRGRAVKKSGFSGVAPMTSSDAANLFHGISVQDIPVGAIGDVKYAGYMLRIFVDGLFGTTLADGDLIQVNADGTLSYSAGTGVLVSSCVSNENITINT